MFKIEIVKTLRLGAESHDVLDRVKHFIDAWSGGDDALVQFYEPQSLCLQRTSPPFAYWRIDPDAFDRFGPLPFTAEGKPIRWTWLYGLQDIFQSAPTLTVKASDLPS
jgi:hypothetical protein